MASCKIPTRAVAWALSQMPVLLVVSQTNPPKFECRQGPPLFDEEAEAVVLDAVVVDALVVDAEILDPEVKEVEVVDTEAADSRCGCRAVCSGNCVESSTNPWQRGRSIP